MDADKIKSILIAIAKADISTDEALAQLRTLPYEDLDFAKLDLHRSLRQGMPEVIFCPGKTSAQIIEIARRLRAHHDTVLASRADADLAADVLAAEVHANSEDAIYHPQAGTIVFGKLPKPNPALPTVAIVTAGTADLPAAEEAALVLQSGAVPVLRVNDVGVAGIHRLFDQLPKIQKASIVIAVAGMDGALPSVIAGLCACPIVALPTSVGYGTGLGGTAALLTMLNSCAAGLTVVNIDNGFGAAMAAWRLIRTMSPSAIPEFA